MSKKLSYLFLELSQYLKKNWKVVTMIIQHEMVFFLGGREVKSSQNFIKAINAIKTFRIIPTIINVSWSFMTKQIALTFMRWVNKLIWDQIFAFNFFSFKPL